MLGQIEAATAENPYAFVGVKSMMMITSPLRCFAEILPGFGNCQDEELKNAGKTG